MNPADANHASNGGAAAAAVVTNGTHGNGTGSKATVHEPPPCLQREQMVRVMLQSLRELGYAKAADTLESESAIATESPVVSMFRTAVLQGNWEQALALLDELRIPDHDLMTAARFRVLEQKFLELLEARQVTEALTCLRGELTPLSVDADRLHRLASLVMCTSAEDVRERAGWDGAGGSSRNTLLASLRTELPADVLLPPHRLETLLLQAVQQQRERCLFHNTTSEHVSLYEDHWCDERQIPRKLLWTLEQHTDEVWVCVFSHDGTMLATGGRDETILIWSVDVADAANQPQILHRFAGHSGAVSAVAWSPDDSLLISSCGDALIKMWDTSAGRWKCDFRSGPAEVTAIAWLADGKHFISAAMDKSLRMWDVASGTNVVLHSGMLMQELAATPDGSLAIAVCADNRLLLLRLGDKSPPPPSLLSPPETPVAAARTDAETPGSKTYIEELDSVASVCVSRDSRYALVSLQTSEIHLWDLRRRRIMQKYSGLRQSRFVIRSAFGGPNDAFVISGSEDSQVFIWHRRHGTLLASLTGHTGSVNSVAWNPNNPAMIASASDDHTVCIWGLDAPATVSSPAANHGAGGSDGGADDDDDDESESSGDDAAAASHAAGSGHTAAVAWTSDSDSSA